MKKDVEHISVNTVKATFLLQKKNGFTYMSEAAVSSFSSYSYSEHFWKYRWKSPFVLLLVITDCGNFTFNWILTVKIALLCLLTQLINVLTKTRNEPKRPKTSQNEPKQPKTSQNDPRKIAKRPKTNQNFEIREI